MKNSPGFFTPTILDVEKISGVSRSTVSRYLNGKSVKADNRSKIELAIEELKFQKNPLASGLKSNKTFTVGVVMPDITDPFFPMIIRAFQKSMLENGYQTILNTYGNDEALEAEQVKTLVNKRVDGLMIASASKEGAHIRNCLQGKLPVVLVDRLIEGLECDSVSVDNYNAVFDAISLAIRKGHTKIGYVRGPEVYTDVIRFKGYVDALSKNTIPFRKEYVVRADLVEHDAARQFMRLMNLPDPPTVIFCSNVYLAIGGFEAVLEYRIRIPEEVSIMAFDRLSSFPYYSFARSFDPEFSSIQQPLKDIGEKTAEVLLKRISFGMENYEAMNVVLKTSFYMTHSVADLAANGSMSSGVNKKEVP